VEAAPPFDRRRALRLSGLFGAVYFLQGLGSPTDGLLAQPVRSLQLDAGWTAGQVADFAGLAALPWVLKPLFGLLSDTVPLAGSHRRSYLIASCAAATLGFAALFAATATPLDPRALLLFLAAATLGVAFADVVVDALMVEVGAPLRLTGRLQSVQWFALYAAGMVAGVVGGWLSAGRERLGFLFSTALAALTLALVLVAVREPRRAAREGAPAPVAAGRHGGLWAALTQPPLPAVAAFLTLWSFNPFGNVVLYVHWTRELGFSEEFYGTTLALLSAGALGAAVAYGTLGRRLSPGRMVHGGILLGVLGNLAYLGVRGPRSAAAASVLVGFCYLTAVLMQLDLAARTCPPRYAGTVFAALMALTNLSLSLAEMLGGRLYDRGSAAYGAETAFAGTIALGALCTASCWALTPWLRAVNRQGGEDDPPTTGATSQTSHHLALDSEGRPAK
jgi:MFS family permease